MKYGKERKIIKVKNEKLKEDLDGMFEEFRGYEMILGSIAKKMRRNKDSLWDSIYEAYPELDKESISSMSYTRDGTIIYYE